MKVRDTKIADIVHDIIWWFVSFFVIIETEQFGNSTRINSKSLALPAVGQKLGLGGVSLILAIKGNKKQRLF